uniref:Uncharacterized protein n=1 Tax=Chromera velia CCMP2878 TaxID=1169474 RepID=A0A0G4HLY3_9ALVE|eukprot:Cvel_7438.t1-p1 / transcript=Cvel_7438.t1 / gene=Cvel_7438 / organism=Chromera_velia_CCMP2878 / gene_product=hypothetical protein / transcript_product=hypothetical protein / location=Cvel_scaffold388:89318-91756(-) / protein_length=201 / sequence_SO=supercontig / SO=protein_coding / is_pseudo=false
MTVEVRKKNVIKRSLVGMNKAEASEEGEEVEAEEGAGVQEAEDEWRKYEAWEAMGVGDRLRFRCDSGVLLQKGSVPSALDQKVEEQYSSSGVECQWVDSEEHRKRPRFQKLPWGGLYCIRSTGAILLRNFLLAFVALLVAVAVWVLVWYDSKEKWRRRRIARRLNLQRLVVPPEGADVSEMITERPRSLAEQETRARRRAQ